MRPKWLNYKEYSKPVKFTILTMLWFLYFMGSAAIGYLACWMWDGKHWLPLIALAGFAFGYYFPDSLRRRKK